VRVSLFIERNIATGLYKTKHAEAAVLDSRDLFMGEGLLRVSTKI
jgi:hypothetical protein